MASIHTEAQIEAAIEREIEKKIDRFTLSGEPRTRNIREEDLMLLKSFIEKISVNRSCL